MQSTAENIKGPPPSLKKQITRLFLFLFIFVQAVAFSTIYTTSKITVNTQIKAELDSTLSAFKRIMENRSLQLSQQADLLAKDYGFREAVATEEASTISTALINILTRGDVDMAVLLDVDGEVVTTAGTKGLDILPSYIADQMDDGFEIDTQTKRFFNSSGALYELKIVPIRAPILIGWVVLGKQLDDTQAINIRLLSSQNVDIAFLSHDQEWLISGASNRGDFLTHSMVSPELSAIAEGHKIDHNIDFKGDTFSIRLVPLVEGGHTGIHDDNAFLLLYSSQQEALSAYNFMFAALAVVGVLGLIILYFGSHFISNKVSLPISLLAKATVDFAKGNYTFISPDSQLKEVSLLSTNFNSMVDAIQEREGQILHHACHDIETNLTNRTHFETEVNKKLDRGDDFALIMVEVQSLPTLRVVLEHGHMNILITQIGKRLSDLTGCMVSRLSTDTFGLIIEEARMAETLMPGIMEAFQQPFRPSERNIDINLIMGVVKAPKHGQNSEALLLNMHAAIDQARAQTKGFAHFDPEIISSQEEHLSLMSDLREDISNNVVAFHYQPKLDIKTGRIKGAEALMRWNSPKHGFVSPELFIPLAEKTGDIQHLTAWALGCIIKKAAEWHHAGHDLLISANLSGLDLQNLELPDLVSALLKEHGLPAEKLCLEVTESAVMNDMDRALAILKTLSEMGIYLSIDDYGTGFSSLSYLKKLPVQELKIDKAFVLNLASSDADTILVQSTIDLAHNLAMSVTAEGVEDQESLDMLKKFNCETAQGYHISRPVPADDFISFIKSKESLHA